MKLLPKSKVSHNLRFTEVEASMEYDMPIDEWYTIPVEAREQMIAGMVSKRWIETLMMQDANKK